VIAFPLSFGFPAYTSIDAWAGSLIWSTFRAKFIFWEQAFGKETDYSGSAADAATSR
jgi:hypothetical protein